MTAAGGKGERIHATTDAHVRSLFVDAQGRVWAGTSGSGLLLRIDKTGQRRDRVRLLQVRDHRRSPAIAPGGSGPPSARPTGRPRRRAASRSRCRRRSRPRARPRRPRRATTTTRRSQGRGLGLASRRRGWRRAGAPRDGGYSSEVVLFDGERAPAHGLDELGRARLRPRPGRRQPTASSPATGPNGQALRDRSRGLGARRARSTRSRSRCSAGEDVGTNGADGALPRGERTGDRRVRLGGQGHGPDEPLRRVPLGGRRAVGRRAWSSRSGRASRRRPTPPGAPGRPWAPASSSAGDPRARGPLPAVEGAHDGARRRSPRSCGASRSSYRNRNASPVVDAVCRARARPRSCARSGSGGSNVFEASAPDEKGIFTGLEESRTEGSPRKLYRKGYRTLQWKASDPDGDTLTYEIEFRPASGGEVDAAAEGPPRDVLLLRHDVASRRRVRLPRDGVRRGVESRTTRRPASARPPRCGSTTRRPSSARPSLGRASSSSKPSTRPRRFSKPSTASTRRSGSRIEPKDGLSDSPRETYVDPPARRRPGRIPARPRHRRGAQRGAASFTAP